MTPTTRRAFLGLSLGAAGVATAAGGRGEYEIFSEGRISKMRLKNRLVRSATWESAATNGEPSETYIGLHRALAAGGVGMIITGYMAPMPPGVPVQTHIFEDRHIRGLEKVAEAVHTADSACKIVAQLGHGGATVGPSGINWPGKKKGRALSTAEVGDVVKHFAEATRRVRDSGFDGVELHGAHAYLLCSFLSPYTNKRTDRYGGSVENRVRIIREIVEQARAKVGPDFPILIKVNSDDSRPPGPELKGGINIDNFPELAAEVEKAGVDAIDVSGNACIRTDIESVEDESYFLKYARAIDARVPVILTGGNRTVERLEQILHAGGLDFFGIARPLIREPDLPNRWLEGRGGEAADCINCNGCFGTITKGSVHCIQV